MINNSPSFSSPAGAPSFSAPSSSPQPPCWANADAHQQILLEHSFSADHANSVAFQPMFNNLFPTSFQPNAGVPTLGSPAPMLVQQPMYVAQELNTFYAPNSTPAPLVKMEPGNDIFAAREFPAYHGSQPMMASMSLPNYATHAPDRRFTFSDAESIGSVASPSSTSDASSRPASAKQGAKRKTMLDTSLDSPAAAGTPPASDAAKASKKASRQASQRRPPPSASHITESGKPFPVIDTSAKHSSLFVPPDTSGLTKREARLVKNRAAAFLSRQRKREQFEEMEIKCKGISMLVWRMWEAIAGPDAGLERVDSTPLAAVLANEEPMARLCLEEVITKKGASIAPTADDAEGTPASEVASNPSTAAPALSAQKDAHAAASVSASASAELEQARRDLAASMQRESELLAQLDALRASVATAQASMSANAVPVTGFEGVDINVGAMPFKGVQGAELPLFVPESPLSKFTLGDASDSAMMLDASHTAGFDLSKTPTLAMFSQNALRSRSAQHFANSGNKVAATGMGLGLDYRFPCASAPSSPSTASSSSMESSQSRVNSLISQHSASSGKAPSTLASVLLLAGMSLMGVGPSARELAAAEASTTNVAAATPSRKQTHTCRRTAKASTRSAPTHVAGQPSSHLSDDDLLMEMGLASASLSEADDEDVDASNGASVVQPASSAMGRVMRLS